ncbi:MAG: nucleotide exchange factor GrpE [Candidatus Berkelbacteria bacterium]|nr:nucleotide exchange factor GrpE [Candidatus Berkelbacteria bacterium]
MVKKKKEIEELKAGWQRTQADFENYKKRIEAEKIGWHREAQAETIKELLPIFANFALAASHIPKGSSWGSGIDLILKQLDDKLSSLGVEKIAPRRGETFDPSLHEAVAAEDLTSVKEGCITRMESEGYRISGKVVCPARVFVKK